MNLTNCWWGWSTAEMGRRRGGGGYGNGQPETENPSLHTDDTPLQVIISECSPNTCLAVGYLYESVR